MTKLNLLFTSAKALWELYLQNIDPDYPSIEERLRIISGMAEFSYIYVALSVFSSVIRSDRLLGLQLSQFCLRQCEQCQTLTGL